MEVSGFCGPLVIRCLGLVVFTFWVTFCSSRGPGTEDEDRPVKETVKELPAFRRRLESVSPETR